MPQKQNNGLRRFPSPEILLPVAVFLICLAGAALLPVDACPDEGGRRMLSDWIFRTGTLPTGNEQETILVGWGFSYALRPYLSAVISAGAMKAASFFTSSARILLTASRLGSVVSASACAYFCARFGRRIFENRGAAVLMAAFVCFMPQVMFLGMYQNNDILSLAAVCAMICFMSEGIDADWRPGSCVGLACAFSVGLLSYYSVYGWILTGVICFIISVLRAFVPEDRKRFLLKRIVLTAGICLAAAGWFFIRNAYLHGGDFIGIVAEKQSRALQQARGETIFPYDSGRSRGFSVPGFLRDADFYWLRITVMSMIGIFGYMNILMPAWLYHLYYAVILSGIALYVISVIRRRPDRREIILTAWMRAACAITFFLHFWQSYMRDYQPQGRYVISLLPAAGYMMARGADRFRKGVLRVLLLILWLVMFGIAAWGTMSKMTGAV